MNHLIRHIAANKKKYAAIYLLITFHLVGIIGIANENSRELFLKLTPFSLGISALIVAWFHTDWNRSFVIFLLLTYLTGLAVEIMGVNSGFPFGSYEYGSSLGIKIYGTPLMIGLNWALLIYCTGVLAEKVMKSLPLKILLASSLMIFIDFWMEPVAPMMDLWEFEGGIAPLKNYAGWFGVSVILHLVFWKFQFEKSNSMGIAYAIIVFCFFAALNLLLP